MNATVMFNLFGQVVQTNQAMEKLQIFIDNYPNSNYLSEANSYISELQTKIENLGFRVTNDHSLFL